MARSKTQLNQTPVLGSTPLHPTYNSYDLPPDPPPSKRQDRNEKILLSAVWAEVQDRLNQSLHNAVLLNLGKADQRHQVSRPWDSQLRIADQSSQPLDPETAIVEVFDRDDINGRLLILGNPGAGKTTTLLDLAAALVHRANTDPTQPIPVMFNLSSWQDDKQTLKDWLLSELKLKYGVSPKLGQSWLEAQTLLPLLDGLDELPPHRQEPAVQKINDWLQSGEGASQLLVCSRREEYELYATKLLLNGAICLEPLTDHQLATYFAALGMAPLWHTVRQDPDFLALVRTPLLLSVSILANDNINPAQWQRLTTPQERLDYLLDAYIQRQLHTPIDSRTYPPHKQPTSQQTRHWLTWLAQQLQAQSEDEFLIEKMQPYMLANRRQKRLDGLIYGLILGLIFGLIYGLSFGLILGLIFCLTAGIVGLNVGSKSINLVENFDFSFPHEVQKSFFIELRNQLTLGLIMGLMGGLMGVMTGGLVELIGGLIFGSISGLIVGLSMLIFKLIFRLKADVYIRVKPNQGIWSSFKNTLILLITSVLLLILLRIGLLYLLGNILEDEQISIIVAMTSVLLIWASIYHSSMACAQHFSLRLVLHRTNAIPWNYARFLNHCTERLLLQRVGGRYRFIHRLIQERFAATAGHRP